MKKRMLGILLAVAGVLAAAEPAITADATTVTVTVPAGYAPGAKAMLVVAASDRGTQLAAWSTPHELVASVPAEGGVYTARFADLGFADGNCVVRAFFESSFEKLDHLVVDAANEYTDVGVLDTEVYGIEYGYKPTGGGSYGKMICAINEGANYTAFRFEGAGSTTKFNFCGETTANAYIYRTATLNTTTTNIVIARNNAVTVNGTKLGDYRTGPMGRRGARVRLNTQTPSTAVDASYGWWYYLKLWGADGRTLVDFIPARRTSDNVVGFYDQAEKRFVTPAGGGAMTAGTVLAGSAFTGIASFTAPVAFCSRGLALAVADSVATVTVPAGLATGKKLILVADAGDHALDANAWCDVAVLSASIPAAGGTFTRTLTDFCSWGTSTLRAYAVEDFTRLATLTANEQNDYRDTGVLDSLCYGFEYGYQPINGAGQYGKTFSSVGGLLRLERNGNGNNPKYNYCVCNSSFSQVTLTFSLDGNACNNIVFRNGVLTHNGTSRGSGWTAPVDNRNSMLRMNNKGNSATDRDCGKWSYLRIYARNGVKLVDYLPAKRADGTIGFIDQAARTFVTPTGGGAYTSDNVTQGTYSLVASYTDPVTFENPTVPVTAEWIGGLDTDFASAANWRCYNVNGAELPAGTSPNSTVTDVTVAGAFAFSFTNGASRVWRTLKFNGATLGADADWRGAFDGTCLVSGFTLDLAGHTLTVDELQGAGTITDTAAAGGTVRVDVPANVTGSNTGVALTGSLKLLKTGAGTYRATQSITATYTGGTVIEQGTAAIQSWAHPTASTSSLVVYTNGVFDICAPNNGDGYVWTRFPLTLAGGTLTNSGVSTSDSCQNLGTVQLTADSTIRATAMFGFVSPGYAASKIALNGHTLRLDAGGGTFRFINTTVEDGTLNISAGGWIVFSGRDSDASQATIDFGASPRWNLQKTVKVGHLIMRANDEGNTVQGAGKLQIFGTFTPYTDYIHNYELQNGSTLDLSVRSTAYPTVNPKNGNYKVTFVSGARVTVDLHGRTFSQASATKVMNWSAIPTNVTFVPDDVTRQRCCLQLKEDGLYAINRGPTIIYLR